MLKTRQPHAEKVIYLVGLPPKVESAFNAALLLPGCRVESFDDAQSALHRVQHRAPDVIVTELVGGPVDGLELIRGAREVDPKILIVALSLKTQSARRSKLYLVVAERLGATYGMAEPLDLSRLVRWVEDAVGVEGYVSSS